MPISINWATRVIHVPQSYLADLGGGKYGLDVDQFRLDLKDIEDSTEGIAFPDTHRHSTEVVLSGVTYARFVEIINDYMVEFEDGNYVVICTGANHNLADVKVLNSVSLIVGNSAGLITKDVSGLTAEESEALDRIDTTLTEVDSEVQDISVRVQLIEDVEIGRWHIVGNQMIMYAGDNVTEVARFNLLDAAGQPSMDDIFERVRV